MFGNWKHVRLFRHWPVWVRFDAFNVCERCLKPPNRPRYLRPVFQRVPLALH